MHRFQKSSYALLLFVCSTETKEDFEEHQFIQKSLQFLYSLNLYN